MGRRDKKQIEKRQQKLEDLQLLSVCPFCKTKRCDEKIICEGCGLNFREIETSNIKQVENRKKNKLFLESFEGEIVLTKKIPCDISRKMLKFLTIMLGLVGVHNFYVKRNIRGVIMFMWGMTAVVCSFLYSYLLTINIDTLSVFGYIAVVPFCTWLWDIFCVLSKKNRFLIPALLKTPIDLNYFYNGKRGAKH